MAVRVRPSISLLFSTLVFFFARETAGAAVRCVPATNPGFCDTRHATIQAAVDAAAPAGDVLSVAAGIYSEQVVVQGKSLTLRGARAGEDARGRTGPESEITHADGPLAVCGDGVVVDGFTLSGATNVDANWAGLLADSSPCGAQGGVRIENNILRDNIVGLSVGGGPAVVRNNWIVNNDAAPQYSHGILAGGAYDWVIEHNAIAGHSGPSITFYGPAQRLTIASNRLAEGIVLARTSDSTIQQNEHVGVAPGSVLVDLSGDDHRIAILGNVLSVASGWAIRVTDATAIGSSSEISAHGNCIPGAGAVGLEVGAGGHTGVLDATSNWWGAASGPSGAGPGSGAALVAAGGAVAFAPFSTVPVACNCAGLPDGTACNDGDLCTVADVCLDSVCVGQGAANCDDSNPCTDDGCSAGTGCTHAPNTGPCDDGNICTSNDRCAQGNCAGGPSICADLDPCTDDGCDPATGACGYTAHQCDDLDNCTTDSCDAAQGGCVYTPFACDDGNPCTVGTCPPASGQCIYTATNCDDRDPCTVDSCSTATGCVHSYVAGPACDDGSVCTLGDVCGAAGCVPGPLRDCSDGNDCTIDECHPTLGCLHGYSTAPCDDGNPCTVNDNCRAPGVCQPGPTISCSDGNPCTDDHCNPETGQCVFTVDDTNACSVGAECGRCVSGACTTPPDACDDGVACTVDSCSASGVCVHAQHDELCPSGDQCTWYSCQPTGCEIHWNWDADCDDGNACTLGDRCMPYCGGRFDLYCGSSSGCTMDYCNPATGCVHVPVNEWCYPGHNCMTRVCDPGAGCMDAGPRNCDDLNPCTVDSCNPSVHYYDACYHTATDCDDADPCTADSCDAAAGGCVHSPACDDGNACTDDSCVPGQACVHTPNDGNTCVDPAAPVCAARLCVSGVCTNIPAPAPAPEIQGVRFPYGKDFLAWDPTVAGTGQRYDVVRGAVHLLPVGSNPLGENCLSQGDSNLLAVPESPPGGSAYFYLVRVRYAVCDGDFGHEGVNGVPADLRVTATCP